MWTPETTASPIELMLYTHGTELRPQYRAKLRAILRKQQHKRPSHAPSIRTIEVVDRYGTLRALGL